MKIPDDLEECKEAVKIVCDTFEEKGISLENGILAITETLKTFALTKRIMPREFRSICIHMYHEYLEEILEKT